MHFFFRAEPTPITSWRMAILMGANSRTYKFALGKALLDLAHEGRDAATLDELAAPYAWALVQRAERFPQGPPAAVGGPRDFLTVLSEEAPTSVEGNRPTERLVSAAADSIPGMVMQKFHNLRGIGEVEHSFYRLTGRGAGRRVELTPDLSAVAAHEELLGDELASRWSIVEACFDATLGRSLVQAGVVLSEDGERLVTWQRRAPVTGARSALVGFQHGRCFYCHDVLTSATRAVHVDHVYPYAFMKTGSWNGPDLNGVWNLVVACSSCNLAKSSRRPSAEEVKALMHRNEAVIASPHPLRRTLELSMRSDGSPPAITASARLAFVREVDRLTTDRGLA